MKTPSILKSVLLTAGFSVVALIGSAKAQVYFNENFDESSFTGFTAPAGTYESSQFTPAVGSVAYVYAYQPSTVTVGAGLEPGSTQSFVQDISTGSDVGFAFGVANAPTVGTLQSSFDFQLTGTIADGAFGADDLVTHTGNYVYDNYLRVTSGGAYIQTSNGAAGYTNSSNLAGSLTDDYQAVYTLNFTSGTYNLNVYDLSTGNSLALSDDNLTMGGGYATYTPTATDYVNQAYISVLGNDSSSGSTVAFDNILLDTPAAIPEPSTVALIGLGALGLAFLIRRHRTA